MYKIRVAAFFRYESGAASGQVSTYIISATPADGSVNAEYLYMQAPPIDVVLHMIFVCPKSVLLLCLCPVGTDPKRQAASESLGIEVQKHCVQYKNIASSDILMLPHSLPYPPPHGALGEPRVCHEISKMSYCYCRQPVRQQGLYTK